MFGAFDRHLPKTPDILGYGFANSNLTDAFDFLRNEGVGLEQRVDETKPESSSSVPAVLSGIVRQDSLL